MKLSMMPLLVSGVFLAGSAYARDQIQIAGSSTVLPYASIVAEIFFENTEFVTPVVESGGSSAGLKKFCEGIGESTIDIANASRAMREKEIEACKKNGVDEIIEVRFGYDGIVFASNISDAIFAFTPSDWYNALAQKVLIDGVLTENNYKSWSDVRTDLPAQNILAFIPGTKHGTREVFEEKAILQGCKDTGAFEALKAELSAQENPEKAAEAACIELRTDGIAIDIDGDYTETLASIEANKTGIGVFGLSFYEANINKLQVATMSGVVPSSDTISSGEYTVSRPLYFYVKKAHLDLIPGLRDYMNFFVSDLIAGADSPLEEYGLVVDPDLKSVQDAVLNEQTL